MHSIGEKNSSTTFKLTRPQRLGNHLFKEMIVRRRHLEIDTCSRGHGRHDVVTAVEKTKKQSDAQLYSTTSDVVELSRTTDELIESRLGGQFLCVELSPVKHQKILMDRWEEQEDK